MEVNFTIGAKEYEVPEVITVDRFEKAMAWDLQDLKNIKPFVASLIDCELPSLNLLDEEVFHIISGVCISRIHVSDCKMEARLGLYPVRDWDSLTFGEWVDIDTFMAMGVTQNVAKIASILYDAPEEYVKKMDIKRVWGAIIEASKWREAIYKEYDEFFEIGEGSGESDGKANVQLMWYNSIIVLADEDFLKIHQVVERPYKEALNFLTWKKAKLQKEQLENLKRKNEIQRRVR